MSRLAQSHFIQGGYYHVYNRGNNKQQIFLRDRDYYKYLEKLEEYLNKFDISLLVYCLMPNHVHLLLRQNGPKSISLLIQRLHTSYSKFFNSRYERVGHVFENRFKTKIIDRDEYLMHLSRYIHLNPRKLVTKLPAYKWSSYNNYIGEGSNKFTDTKFILAMFKNKNQSTEDAYRNYKQFVKDQQESFEQIEHLIFPE